MKLCNFYVWWKLTRCCRKVKFRGQGSNMVIFSNNNTTWNATKIIQLIKFLGCVITFTVKRGFQKLNKVTFLLHLQFVLGYSQSLYYIFWVSLKVGCHKLQLLLSEIRSRAASLRDKNFQNLACLWLSLVNLFILTWFGYNIIVLYVTFHL